MSEPLTIRVLAPDPLRPARSHGADDLTEQYGRVCINALATAVQRDCRPPALAVPTGIPAGLGTTTYITRVSAPGSVDAAALDAAQADVLTWEVEAAHAEHMQLWDLYDRAIARQREAIERVTKLTIALRAIDTAPRRAHGPSNLYLITVPAVAFVGGMEATYAERRHVLNTHALPDDLRAWLIDYAQSGTTASPYRLKSERLCPRDDVPDDTRDRLREVWRAVPN